MRSDTTPAGTGSAAGTRRRRLRWRWTDGALVLVVAYGVLTLVVTRRLEHPQRRLPGPPPPPAVAVVAPVTLSTVDGLDLAAWEVEPPGGSPRAVVLVTHALHGCRSPGDVAFLAEAGLAGLLLDHRAHGASAGERTTFGVAERFDVAAAVAHIRQRWPGLPLLGWGRSLGAAALLHALADPALELGPERFEALALESLYTDLDSAFEDRVRLHAGAWALPFALAPRWLLRRRLPLEQLTDAGRPLALLERLVESGPSAPRLLLAGGALDRHAPPERLAALARVAGADAVLVELPGVGHVDLLGAAPRVYGDRLRAFLRAGP